MWQALFYELACRILILVMGWGRETENELTIYIYVYIYVKLYVVISGGEECAMKSNKIGAQECQGWGHS